MPAVSRGHLRVIELLNVLNTALRTGRVSMLSYFLAVLAACANATSSVLQRKANKKVPQDENASLRQIRRLLHEPVWFGGIAAITAGFLLQASALGAGELAGGEQILVIELPLTLILAARILGASAMGPREGGAWLVGRGWSRSWSSSCRSR